MTEAGLAMRDVDRFGDHRPREPPAALDAVSPTTVTSPSPARNGAASTRDGGLLVEPMLVEIQLFAVSGGVHMRTSLLLSVQE